MHSGERFSCSLWDVILRPRSQAVRTIQPSDQRNVRTDGGRCASVNGLPAPFGFASRVDHDGPPHAVRFRSAIGWMVQPPRANEKELIMTTKNPNAQRPLYRVAFSRITGKDDNGQDILGKPREIGAVWPRKNGKSGALLTLDLIPTELVHRQGVIFLLPVDAAKGGSQ